MRISTITNWAYGVTVLLTGLSGTAFILAAQAASGERRMVERHLILDDLGDDLVVAAEKRTDEARLYAMRLAPRHLAAFRADDRDEHAREHAIQNLRAAGITPVEAASLKEAEDHLDELDAIEVAAVAAVERGDVANARAALFGPDHERAQANVLEPVHRFRELVEARTTGAMRDAQAISDGFNLFARIMLGLTAAVFLAVLYFVLRRRVAIPLARMTGIVTRLARQDYAVEVPNDRRRDEIGDMNQAIQVFRINGMERDRLDAERIADQRIKDSILAMMHRLQACESEAELAEVVACFAPQIFPDLAGHLYVLDDTRTALSPAVSWLDPTDPGAAFAPAACWGLRRGRPHVSNRDHSDIACPHLGACTVPSLCVPLTAQGDAVGLLYFEERTIVDADEVGGTPRLYLELMAENIGLALANLRLRERLTNLAVRDALTGLLNRRSLDEALNRHARMPSQSVACLMIDIDHFKRFNDHFGHDAGDAVMQHVARILRDAAAGRGGSAYRFGGEEFTLLLPDRNEAEAQDCAERIRAHVAATPLSHRGRILGSVTVSIGAAVATGGASVPTLVSCADAALLQAKADGRDRVMTVTALGARAGKAA